VVRTEDISRKRETDHRRLYLDAGQGALVRATWFNAGTLPPLGGSVDIAFHIDTSSYRGDERLELALVDWRPADRRVVHDVAALVAGREVVDWRSSERDWQSLAAALKGTHGEGLVVWAEGIEPQVAGTLTRCELLGRRATALAILTPPPEPAVLRALLVETQARLVYLLPPLAVDEPLPSRFVQSVAGMVRVSLRAHTGRVDLQRMAARLGARQAAVLAVLRGLEAAGKITLAYTADGLTVSLLQTQAPPPDPTARGEDEDAWASAQAEPAGGALQQARAALIYLLGETGAYRRFYALEPLEAIFYLGE